MSRPKIFVYCEAGCPWEAPHKDEVFKKSIIRDVILSASAWSGGIYTWEYEAITSACSVEFIPQSGITSAQLKALQKANIIIGEQTEGSIQLVAFGTVPAIDIPVEFIVRRNMVVAGSEDEPDVEEIAFTVNEDGSVSISGVEFIEQADGSVLVDGAELIEQEDGAVLIQ